ncbi:MAG: leucine-rich repeat protein [Bacteroidales bacterium]|nr:leucine-rich repeat protein [Bacteroidales bacterium]
MLNIRISNENNYSASYKVPLGTATHTITPYDYYDLPFPAEGGTGVYHLEMWLDASGLQSEHLRYNIMCVAEADQHTAQLVVMNSSLNKIVNYDENTVFEYSCYNAGGTTATPYLKLQSIIGTVPTVLVEGSLGVVETAKALSYTYQPEIESWEEGMQLQAILTNGNEQTIIYQIDNSKSYPAVGGASFYLKPASRSNTEEDRETIINQADHSRWQAFWENMSWKDGIDGWTVDESGKKCLFLPAGSKVEMQVQPMKAFTNKTIDLVYKVNHIADYDEPLFSICDDPSSESFNGIVIYPDRVVVYTNDKKSTLVQSRNFREGVRQHLAIVYANNYKGIGNLVTIYQNGVAQCEFQYETKDLVTNAGYVKMGCDYSNLYVYSMMCYEKALAWPDAAQNWISSLSNADEKKAAMDALMKCVDDSFNMSFDAVVASGLDYMVIEMTEGKIPSYVSQASGKCNVELKVKGWWDTVTKFFDIPIEGQGTTAMNYWLWNLRLKLALLAFFAGKWTAKINWASEMQNHKMFGVNAYNELYHAIGLANEVNGPVAITQKPVLAFEKRLVDAAAGLYSYEFIGLYTFGPDKGNDAYFKFDDARFADNIIYLEGMDHNVKGGGYDYPPDKMSYKESEEAICNNAGEAALEVRKCGNAKTESEVQAKLNERFMPFYEFVYSNNPLLKGTSASLDEMNANTDAWGKQTDAEGHRFERFEFWIDGVYDVLYLDKKEGKYMSNGTNLLTQLSLTESDLAGLTIEEKNEKFIKARVERFKASIANYIDVRDNMYKLVICFIIFASDNGIKNTYIYRLAELYRQLQDDLDSIFKSDNQSLFSKEFWQEMFDFADEKKSAYAFKGEHNVLEQLLRMAFPELEKEIAHQVLDAMVSLSPYGDNTIDKLMGYLQSRSWDKAQGYFPKSAYNNFTALAYEGAWPAYIGKSTVSYTVDVNPLSQVVGDSLETEMNFMYFRLIYVMSKYAYGPFANYDDKCLGQITWRTQASQSLTLTPAFPLYPAALSGQTGKKNADRRYMAGESVTFEGLGGSNTNVYIAGADCYEDVGDLSDIIVDSAVDATLQISAKRLKTLKVGDEVSASSNIGRLMLTSTPSLESLDARNLKNLASDVDLSNSPRLKEALLAGSVSTGVSLKRGQKIQVLSLPATISSLELLDLPNLTDETLTLEGLGNVTFLRLENCKGVDMFELLKTAYKTEGNRLTNIRIVGFVYDGNAEDLDMLAHFADDTDAEGNERVYNGIDADGKTDTLDIPVIEGVLNLDGYVYEETAETVRANYPNLVFQPLGYYIKFEDPNMLKFLLDNLNIDDGIGITREQAESLTTIPRPTGNTSIVSFDEFEKFINVTNLETANNSWNYGYFRGCTALKSIKFPINMSFLGAYSFADCAALETIGDLPNVTVVGAGCFRSCPLTGVEVYFPMLTTIGGEVFSATGVAKVKSLGYITELPDSSKGTFHSCTSLTEAILPDSLVRIGNNAFAYCSALESISVDWTKIEKLGANAFHSCSALYIDYMNLAKLTNLGQNALNGVKIKKLILSALTAMPTATTATQNFGKKDTLEEVVLSNAIVTISSNSFYAYLALKRVNLDNVVTIGESAFNGCTSLLMPNLSKVETLNSRNIFYGCTAIEGDLYLPSLKGRMDYQVFCGCNIERIIDLGQVEDLGSYTSWTNSAYGVFKNCKKLFSAILPDTLLVIGNQCFAGCSSLEDMALPKSITTIGDNAFEGCTKLKLDVLDLPNLSGTLGNQSFVNCKGLKRIENLGQITVIASTNVHSTSRVFAGCDNLEFVRLPITLTALGTQSANPFHGCAALKTIVCEAVTPPTLTAAGSMPALKEIAVPSASMSAYAEATNWSTFASKLIPLEDYDDGGVVMFEDPAVEAICVANWDTNKSGYMSKNECAAVTSLASKFKGNTEIISFDEFKYFTGVLANSGQHGAFSGCTSLVSISIPKQLNVNANELCNNCTSLETVTLEDGIASIGYRWFNGCSNLTEINLPSSITSIGETAFNGCSKVNCVINLPNLTSIGTQAFQNSGVVSAPNLGKITSTGNQTFQNCKSLMSINIPETVVTVPYRSFNGCVLLEGDINLPNVTSIGEMAFYQTSIKSCSIPLVKTFENQVFEGCKKLETVNIIGAETIKSSVFNGCSKLTSVEFGENINGIGWRSFFNCSSLTHIVCRAITPPTLGSEAFGNTNSTFVIYVPDEAVDAYKAASNWASYASRIKPLSEYNG